MTYKEFLQETVKECKSKADLCRALDLIPQGGTYKQIDNIIKKYQLDISHFSNNAWNKDIKYHTQQYNIEDILVKNSPITNTTALKKRLIRNGLKQYKCEICGFTEKVELHHINGDSRDNRLENLQILCPNCHALTDNYRGKNVIGRRTKTPESYIISDPHEIMVHKAAKKLSKRLKIPINDAINIIKTNNLDINNIIKDNRKKQKQEKICQHCGKIYYGDNLKYCSTKCANAEQSKNIPNKEELISKIIEYNATFAQIGKFYNVSDNTIKKWCKKYNLPYCKHELIDWINNNYNKKLKQVPVKKIRKYDNSLIIRIYNEGYTQKEIANFINCSEDYIHKVIIENNIKIRKNNGITKKIAQYTLDGSFLQYFYTSSECIDWLINKGKTLSKNGKHHITDNCNNKSKTAYGYIWKYIDRKPIESIK